MNLFLEENNMQQTLFKLDEPETNFSNVNVRDFIVKPVAIQQVKNFIERWHYSKNVNGLNISNVFGLFYKNQLLGAIIYGSLSMANTWQKYGSKENEVVELKRLCCVDNTKKNTESFFIGKTIKFLKKFTKYKIIVSYADPFYKHSGIIYKATNFKHKGYTAKSKVILYNDKIYHDKTIRSVDNNNNYKPFTYEIKKALKEGKAKYIDKPPKHIYCYEIQRKEENKNIKAKIVKQLNLL